MPPPVRPSIVTRCALRSATTSPAHVAGNGQTSARRLLTVQELEALLGVSADYVYRHADDLAALRLPGRDRRGGAAALETVRSRARGHAPALGTEHQPLKRPRAR